MTSTMDTRRRKPVLLISVVAVLVVAILAWLLWPGGDGGSTVQRSTQGPYTVQLSVDDPHQSGTLAFVNPETGRLGRAQPLAKHPRKLEVWGLDIRALQSQGSWTFAFTIDGPSGPGKGELRDLQVLEQPGPPMGVSWSISLIPLIVLVVLITIAWRRTRSRLRGDGIPAVV